MRFSIRDLLWATLVVAMGLAWWLSYRAVDARRLEAVGQADKMRGLFLSGETELIGKWKVVSVERNGEQVDIVENYYHEFTSDGQMIHTSDNGEFRYVYHLTPDRDPKHITVIEVPPEAKVYKGIYQIEGDSLTLCLSDLADRPMSFRSVSLPEQPETRTRFNIGRTLYKMERVHDTAVQP